MRICRFDENRLGLAEDDYIFDVTEALEVLPNYRWPVPHGDALISNLPRIIERIQALRPTAAKHSAAEVRFLSPIANPSKIIALVRPTPYNQNA